MANLRELNTDMVFIMRTIATEEIAKLLSAKDPSEIILPDTPYNSIAYKNLFPFPKIITAEEEVNTYIFIYYGNINPKRQGFYYDKTVNIDVVSHIDTWQINEGIRPYIIMNKIDELLNKTRIPNVKALREFLPLGARPINVNPKWSGYSMSYSITDGGRDCNV